MLRLDIESVAESEINQKEDTRKSSVDSEESGQNTLIWILITEKGIIFESPWSDFRGRLILNQAFKIQK